MFGDLFYLTTHPSKLLYKIKSQTRVCFSLMDASNLMGGKKSFETSEEEVFWPLVAFTTQTQIIEGHGNLSDR